jgi:hypothetical protein
MGVDAIVAEGFEAGGHNGRDETTTFNLMVKEQIKFLYSSGWYCKRTVCLQQWH